MQKLTALTAAFLALAAGTAIPAAAQTATAPAPAAPAAAAAPVEDFTRDFVLGDVNAPVTLVEYGSFTCPHCAAFSNDVLPKLKADFIDTGKVKFIHREVYFDRYGLWAAMVARCGGEMRYHGLIKALYAGQRDWLASDDPAVIADNLRKIGRTAGMTDEQVNACLQNEAMIEAMVAAYQKHVDRDGVTATPTLLVNGKKYNNMPYSELKPIIEKAIGG